MDETNGDAATDHRNALNAIFADAGVTAYGEPNSTFDRVMSVEVVYCVQSCDSLAQHINNGKVRICPTVTL